MGLPANQGHRSARTGQHAAEIAADGAGAHDGDSRPSVSRHTASLDHQPILANRCSDILLELSNYFGPAASPSQVSRYSLGRSSSTRTSSARAAQYRRALSSSMPTAGFAVISTMGRPSKKSTASAASVS